MALLASLSATTTDLRRETDFAIEEGILTNDIYACHLRLSSQTAFERSHENRAPTRKSLGVYCEEGAPFAGRR